MKILANFACPTVLHPVESLLVEAAVVLALGDLQDHKG
jgi:hypothetical protein